MEVGLAVIDPPLADVVRLLPLVPVTVTPVAFVAVIVKTVELPLVIDVGLALMVTVGAPDVPPAPTVMVTDAEAVPPDPVAVAVYVVVEVGLTDIAPPPDAIVRLLPLVPVIVIPVAFLAVTVKTEELPLEIVVGLALIVTVGAPDESPAVTVIVADAEAVPPDPVAVAVYVVVEVGLTEIDPPVARIVRLLPLVPVMEIPVAFLAVTVKTEELPLEIVVGLALIVTVGAPEESLVVTVIVADAEAVPPDPVAVAV